MIALVSMGADLKLADKFGKTALIHAAMNGHEDAVHTLVANGGNELNNTCKVIFFIAADLKAWSK